MRDATRMRRGGMEHDGAGSGGMARRLDGGNGVAQRAGSGSLGSGAMGGGGGLIPGHAARCFNTGDLRVQRCRLACLA